MNQTMKLVFVMFFFCSSVSSLEAQSKIIFSRSSGMLNTGTTPDLMVYDLATPQTQLLQKGLVSGRGEYAASSSPDNSKILVNTYLFGGWKLGIAQFIDGKLSKIEKFTTRSNYEYNASWSHDGKKVAFQEFNWGKRETDIFLADANGKNVKQFTTAKGGDRNPHWTRDDKNIVFTSGRVDDYEIYLKPLNDGKAINLSNHPATDFAPSTSKSNDKIAFLSDRNGSVHLFAMNYDGSGLINLTLSLKSKAGKGRSFENDGYWAYQTSWSPDGKQIVFNVMIGNDLEIFIINSDGKNLRQITDNNDSDICPHWMN